jgi:putative oligomerization/nucleic acid binding protein
MKRNQLLRYSLVWLLSLCAVLVITVQGKSDTQENLEKKLQALEQAHQAGILSPEEYARKKEQLEAQIKAGQAQLDHTTQQKLKALEAAHQAGILSDQEYAQKKVELTRKSPALDDATLKKLKALEAAHQAGILSDQEFARKKAQLLQAPANVKVPPAVKSTAPVPTKTVRKPGKTHKHPVGFSFWYPADWQVAVQDEMMQLTPPTAKVSAEGPLELYFLAAESIAEEGIKRPDEPKIIQYLDEQVKSLSPLLNRTGGITPLKTSAGPGATMDWQATAPTGIQIKARTYTAILKEYGVILVAMGQKEYVEKRDVDLRDIFSSLTWQNAQGPLITPKGTQKTTEAPATQPQAIDPALQQKLNALETARQVGILSDQEFAQKKAELLGDKTPVATTLPEGSKIRYVDTQKGKMYRHVIGFSFWHPAAWTVKEHDDFLQLVPPNAATSPDGPTEAYFIVGDSVADEGITNPGDPVVVQYLDQQVMSIANFLRRTGGPEPVDMAHSKGVVLKWQGNNPKGDLVFAQAYVSIIKDNGVALLALGLKEPLEKRTADVRKIFASFGFGPGQLDQKLVGNWNFLRTTSITNWSPYETDYSRAQLVSESTALLEIRADGTWMRTDKSQMLAGAGGVWIESNEKKVDQGRWYAGKGELYLISKDNTWEDYKYTLRQTQKGLQLLLASGNQGELWLKAQ